MFSQHLEEASLKSWPAQQQLSYDGWLLRLSEGYTKRANSITALSPSSLPLDAKILFCEQTYQKHNLPTIFRLLSYSPETPSLDQALEARAYRAIDSTLVLSTPLPAFSSHNPSFSLDISPLSTWFELFCQFSSLSATQQQLHFQLLARIPSSSLFAVLRYSGQPVACGLGIKEATLFGLFDIIVNPGERNKGYGTRLVSSMLTWAREQGAHQAYLQVLRSNQLANHLYARLGFLEQYHYWYRVNS
jgi:N-acetylglutamate synthase